jgi:hypothetical protein
MWRSTVPDFLVTECVGLDIARMPPSVTTATHSASIVISNAGIHIVIDFCFISHVTLPLDYLIKNYYCGGIGCIKRTVQVL